MESGHSRPLSLPKIQKRNGNVLPPKVAQTRKLISQILIELKKRKKPPSPFQVDDPLSLNKVNPNPQNVFNADDTCDLLGQLRDVLVVCSKNGINFGDRMSATPPDSPYASRDPSPNRSRSPSPPRTKRDMSNQSKGSGILERILDVLYDIVQNDCRYKVIPPRPFRPPNALQSIVLDVAHLLVNQNPFSPGWLYELGMAMIPGFNIFNDVLRAKLLIFYADFLIPQLMACQGDPVSDVHHGKSNGKVTMNEFENSSHINITINSDDPVSSNYSLDSEYSSKSNADRSADEHSFNRRQSAARKLSRRLSISYTGYLDIDAYYIDSVFTPLLYSIMQFISVEDSTLETLYQMHRTIGIMVQCKPDLYNDVIEIIAHGDTISRNQAINILFCFWRDSTGHPSIGETLPNVGYMYDLLIKEKEKDFQNILIKNPSSVITLHQFLPHIFLSTQNSKENKHASLTVDMHGQSIPTEHPNACVKCFKTVSGFGLRCGGCKLNVHVTCYNLDDGEILTEYAHKLSTPKYCNIAHGPREVIYNDSLKDSNPHAVIISETVAGHRFHLVNIFTLVLCMVCRMPLWGVMYQGYRCESCNKFVHPRCMKSVELEKQLACHPPLTTSEGDALIEHEMLRLSFKTHYESILIPEESISSYSFEELSVMMTILQMQDNILRNGIMAGCLIVNQKYHNPLSLRTKQFDKFELQEFSELYQSYLSGGKVTLSIISNEYWEGIDKEPPLLIISCEDYLAHLASIIKTSDISESGFVDRHLSVHTTATLTATSPGDSNGILTTKEMMMWLQKNLGFRSSYTSKTLLQQMVNYGFLERIDGHPILFYDEFTGKHLDHDCTFPLPFAIECSPTVESLTTAITACLSDINISMNECGLLLMTRRCWPDSFLSRYILERLIYAIIEWVCSEDDKLLIIAREYTPSHLKLPGVRDEMETKRSGTNQKQPSVLSSSAGGGAYIVCRKMLREKYIVNWMSAIHDMNQGLFCDIVFDQIEMLYENQSENDVITETEFQSHDRILKCIIRLWHSGLLFSSFNDMIARWMDDVYHIMKYQVKFSWN